MHTLQIITRHAGMELKRYFKLCGMSTWVQITTGGNSAQKVSTLVLEV